MSSAKQKNKKPQTKPNYFYASQDSDPFLQT